MIAFIIFTLFVLCLLWWAGVLGQVAIAIALGIAWIVRMVIFGVGGAIAIVGFLFWLCIRPKQALESLRAHQSHVDWSKPYKGG